MKFWIGVLGLGAFGASGAYWFERGQHDTALHALNDTQASVAELTQQIDVLARENRRLLALNHHWELMLAGGASTPPASAVAAQLPGKNTAASLDSVHIQSLLAHDSDALLLRKHALLLSSLNLSPEKEDAIKALLAMRERISNTSSISETSTAAEIDAYIRTQQAALNDVDNKIAQLLEGEDRETYDLFKDSSYEQSQLLDFLAQTPDAGNLTDSDKRNLLRTKLSQKKQFYGQLEYLSRDINAAQGEARELLIEQAREALHNFKDDYLRSARAGLTEAQFDALREYEQKHFDEIWQSLAAGFGG